MRFIGITFYIMEISPITNTNMNNNLQPLFGAILEQSKLLSKVKFWINIATFAIAISSIYIGGQYLFAACAAIGVTEIIAWWIKFVSNSRKELGQEILRANMIKEAFGDQSRLSISYLTSRIPKSAWKKTKKHLNQEYYADNDTDKGKEKLSNVLQESCFWSQYLYSRCAYLGLIKAAVFALLILFVAISYSVYMVNDQIYSAPRIFILLIVVVPLWDQIEGIITWFISSSRLKDIDHRLESVDCTNESDIFALFADYNVVTSKAPLIPQKVYEDEKDVLNQLWQQRIQKT